jgi:hypothetical protein
VSNALFTEAQRKALLAAWRTEGPPIVKLFGGSACTWLISEMDPEDCDTLFGLADLVFGSPELGYLSLSEIATVRFKPFMLGVERDRHWSPEKGKTLSQYADEARAAGRIRA